MISSMGPLAAKGLTVAENLATQRVIGYSKSRTYRKGKKNPQIVQENVNVGIQAWEIGMSLAFILAGIAAYDFVEGAGALAKSVKTPLSWGLQLDKKLGLPI